MTKTLRAAPALTVAEVEAVRAVGGGVVLAEAEQSAKARSPEGLRKRRGLTVKRVEAALRASSGIKALAAEMLEEDRSRIMRFCEAHPQLEAVIAEEVEAVIDLAEAKLIEKIRAGDASAIRYYLDNHGGARGYGRKAQLDSGAIAVAISGTDAEL